LRVTTRPDADIVDAMCELDLSLRSDYHARVAMRAFRWFVLVDPDAITNFRTARARLNLKAGGFLP
jgi:hypothetical protein